MQGSAYLTLALICVYSVIRGTRTFNFAKKYLIRLNRGPLLTNIHNISFLHKISMLYVCILKVLLYHRKFMFMFEFLLISVSKPVRSERKVTKGGKVK